MNISIEKIVGTLLHEMVHLYNLQNNIKDTSRSGLYHNKNFKEIAEMKGLNVEKSEQYGWCITEIKEEVKDHINISNLNSDCFVIARRPPFKSKDKDKSEDKDKKKSSTRTYQNTSSIKIFVFSY